jgi:hypothetical protein
LLPPNRDKILPEKDFFSPAARIDCAVAIPGMDATRSSTAKQTANTFFPFEGRFVFIVERGFLVFKQRVFV